METGERCDGKGEGDDELLEAVRETQIWRGWRECEGDI
jgi:hypothetical protein